ncbi:MAG: Mth938-like domain-containing protein [Planctomycetota bacterium]|jgi:hypothetical protein
MHIDSYKFGKIVIDGTVYDSDCILIGQQVQPDWWRKNGHLLSNEDLDLIVQAKPEVLVIGTGAAGIMKVPQEVIKFLQQQDIDPEVMKTTKAVQRYNELSETAVNVAAGFHLTC